MQTQQGAGETRVAWFACFVSAEDLGEQLRSCVGTLVEYYRHAGLGGWTFCAVFRRVEQGQPRRQEDGRKEQTRNDDMT